MSSNAIQSQGTKFAVAANASPPVFSDIPEVRTIGGPDGQAPLIDVTDLDSTAREFLLGLKDEGAFTLGIFLIPSNAVHNTLRDAWSQRTLMRFRITFADTTTTVWEFLGYVQSMAGQMGVDEAVQATVGIKVSGSIYQTT